jgi:NADPH2:quinone reductase
MKAIRISQYGDPSVMQLVDIPQPKPGPGDALVRVHSAGVNYADIYFRTGAGRAPIPFPYTLGMEGAGVVEAVGERVGEVKVGDRVSYTTRELGSYAEYHVVNAMSLVLLPKELSFEDAAAVTLQGLTAHYLLHDFYPIKRGSIVLVHAAAGGMGLLLVQWLKHMGAVAMGTVSTQEKAQVARAAGADHVILYAKDDFAEEAKKLTNGRGVDYVIDGVGKTTFTRNLDALRVRGWATIFGMASGPADPISPNALAAKSITISGGALFNYTATREELLRRMNDVLKGLREGWLKLRVEHAFPLAQAAQAHRLLEGRQTTGKLILTV